MRATPLLLLRWLAAVVGAGSCFPATGEPLVPRFGLHEVTIDATGNYANPYVECAAEATLTAPDGRSVRTLPLFWDGGRTWRFRFAPDLTGRWRWTVRSADPGLDGRSGSFTCEPSERRGSLQPMPDASRHFQYQNGERMWFLGDTAWALLQDDAAEQVDRAAVERYVRRRASEGFNVVHSMVLQEAGWGNRGGPPWTDLAAEMINPAYFREADERIAYANAHGLVTGLALAWGNKSRKEPWSWGQFPSVAARLRYVRYLAARYAAYDVYFLVAGEWHGEVRARNAPAAEVRAEFVQLGDALRAADPHRRMIGIHPMTAHGSTREFNEAAAWMDFADYQQNYDELHARALASRPIPKPVINSEYGYYLRDQDGDGRVDKPHSYTPDDMRHATWDIVMAGAYVITGFGSTYMGGHRHPTPFLPDDPKNIVWAEQLGRVKDFFMGLEYWKLEPHEDLISCATPRGADRKERDETGPRPLNLIRAPAAAYWCLAEPGRSYAVYVRGVREPVWLRVTGAMRWNARRFDPRTGEMETLRLGVGPRGVQLRAPDERDWVFVVQTGRR